MLERPAGVVGRLEMDRQRPRRPQVAGRRQFLTADDVFVSNTGQVDRRPHPAMDLLNRRVVVVQRPDSHPLAARQPIEFLADTNRSGSHRTRHDRAMPLDDERTIDRQSEPLGPAPLLDHSTGGADRGPQLVESPAGSHGRRHDRGVGQECAADQFADVDRRDLARGFVDQIAFGESNDAVPKPEQPENLQMLASLRHDRIVGRDDQERQVNAGRPRQHVLDEPLVTWHVDDAEPEFADFQVSETDIDGDAASLFLGQAIGVDAGQRLDERGLAVVDMSGGAEDQFARHGGPPAGIVATDSTPIALTPVGGD